MAQKIELLGREPDRAALHEKFSSLEINFQVAGNIGGDRFPGGRAPQRRANPRQQLFHAEGLDDVIIGPGVEREHLVVFRVAHGEHDDGHIGAVPNFAAGFQPPDARHIDVQKHEFRTFLPQHLQGLFPALGLDDGVSIA